MRYMMMLVRSDPEWEPISEASPAIMEWWGGLAERGVLTGGEQLHPPGTATTVGWDGDRPIVTDGPFMESKESIAGYGILEVANLDAALDIAKGWPARVGYRLEIRPIVIR